MSRTGAVQLNRIKSKSVWSAHLIRTNKPTNKSNMKLSIAAVKCDKTDEKVCFDRNNKKVNLCNDLQSSCRSNVWWQLGDSRDTAPMKENWGRKEISSTWQIVPQCLLIFSETQTLKLISLLACNETVFHDCQHAGILISIFPFSSQAWGHISYQTHHH